MIRLALSLPDHLIDWPYLVTLPRKRRGKSKDNLQAFLNGELLEEVYMDQPFGFSQEGSEHLASLKGSRYTDESSRQWYLKFHEVRMTFGFKENTVDQCIYLKVSGSKFVFLVLYVDDILLASSDLGLLHEGIPHKEL